jgi:hypothetical protein
MAVLDKNKVGKQNSDATESADSKETKGRKVDVLQDKSLPTGEVHKLDAEEDAWAFSAPPKTGRYKIKLFLGKDGVICYDDDKDKESGYSINLEGKIVESEGGEFDNITVFPKVVTFFGRGKSISTAAGLLVKMGYKLPDSADQVTIAKLVVMALKKEPIIDVELDWQGWSKLEKRVVYKGMTSFPVGEDNEYQHIVDYKSSKGSEEIRAQCQVVHWYGKGEQSKAPKGPATGSGNVVQLRPADDEGGSAPTNISTNNKGPAPASDDDLAAMLQMND